MIPTSQAGLLMESGEVVGHDGAAIGKVGTVYVDDSDGHLTWVTVKTGFFGTHESFVPLDDATVDGSTVTVPYDKAMVKDAPHFDADSSLSVEEEDQLYSYYRVGGQAQGFSGTSADYTTTPSDSALSGDLDTERLAGRSAVDTAADGYITRSEEELHVGTRTVEAGRARLKKYVVTEQQTVTVPVSHEEVTLVREPIAAGQVTDAVIGDDVIEVTLSEDQVVVDKQAVAVEKIKLGTETVTEQRQVTEAVRKEQVEMSTDGVGTGTGHTAGIHDTTGTAHSNGTDAEGDPSLADKAKGLVDKATNAVK